MIPWYGFAVALGIGLSIGLEQERSKGDGPTRRPAGIRTFALAILLGAVAVHLGGTVLLAVALAGVIILTALSYLRSHDTDRGLTTESGLVAAPLLGALAMAEPPFAAGLAAAVTVEPGGIDHSCTTGAGGGHHAAIRISRQPWHAAVPGGWRDVGGPGGRAGSCPRIAYGTARGAAAPAPRSRRIPPAASGSRATAW